MNPRRSSPRRLGPLTIIASILVLSAAVRLLGMSGAAFALDASDEVNTVNPSVQSVEEMDAVLEGLSKRQAEIAAQEMSLDKRVEKIEAAERVIKEQFAALQTAEARLRDLLSIASTAAEDDVARLTAVYENMKPKDAATVFEQMQPVFAAGFLARMRPDAAASIMAGLSPQTAYAISVTLAGRHGEPAGFMREE